MDSTGGSDTPTGTPGGGITTESNVVEAPSVPVQVQQSDPVFKKIKRKETAPKSAVWQYFENKG